ncbi:TonB-dependent receptor domain-containing protein [Thalassotalea mangrovi]|uniref:TonB-dependent receptor n=1 Tax=Thalassotalea mangrovi TaxID=2572245 RepID=A0A4U1B5Y2_9GAMM|nr:TonB-dependent receptor [Thalassotalea mangrovi]TKB45311.1 TonB-dependent receptor [Thalassotalea mangrovi]
MNKNYKKNKLTINIALALSLGTTPLVMAQQQDNGDNDIETIMVTGSYIKGTPEDAALPVEVIDMAELQDRGNPTVLDIIKSLAITGPVLGDSNQFVTAAQNRIGGGSINLRGLGPQRTLVLLNGQRIQYGQVDTNMIPMAAIARIEILKDGAAATYGSDAIGGVVNIITRDDFNGFEIAADHRFVDGSDGDSTLQFTYGWSGENNNLLLSAGYQHRSDLPVVERDWADTPRDVNPTSYSVFGNPGSLYTLGADFSGTGPYFGYTADANCEPLGGENGFIYGVPLCYWSYAKVLNLVEEENRYQVYAEYNHALTDSTNLKFDALYAVNETPELRSSPSYFPLQGPNGPGSFGVFYTLMNNPGAVTALQQAGYTQEQIDATAFINLNIWRPFALSGNPTDGGLGGAASEREYTLQRYSLGLDGDFGNSMQWQLSAMYSRDEAFARTPDILINRLQSALLGFGGSDCSGMTPGENGCEFFNPFSNAIASNPVTGNSNPGFVADLANSDSLNAWLFDDILQEAISDYLVLEGVITGELDWGMSGGMPEYAVGLQYRSLDYDYQPLNANSNAEINPCPVEGQTDCAFKTGPFIFQGQTVPAMLSETVRAVFAELNLPITEDFNLQAAIRYEDYGGQTGSTTNPKLSLKWQPAEWLTLRSSVGTTFRGPTPGNRASSGQTLLTGIAAVGNAYKAVDMYGNPDVGPEEAFTYNLGTVFNWGNFSASVDYWSYELEDQIVTVPANIIATSVAGVGDGSQLVNCDSSLRDLIVFANNDTCTPGVTIANDITRVRSDTTNGPTVDTSGVDMTVNYLLEGVGAGDLRFNLVVSHVAEYEQEAFIYNDVLVSEGYDAVGYANYDRLPGTISEWRGTAYAQYEMNAHTARVSLNYIGSVEDNRGPTVAQTDFNLAGCTLVNASDPGCKLIDFGLQVDSFQSVDFNYTYDWSDLNTQFSVAVLNAFDEDPSAARLELSYDPSIGTPYGRTFKLGFRTQF